MRKLSDLREHLFDTIEKLKNNQIPIDDAKAICQVAQVIVNTARTEIDFLKLHDGIPAQSEFLSLNESNK